MYQIEADLQKNLLILKLKGWLTDIEIKQAADKCIAEAKKLAKGYTVINDISEMQPATPKATQDIVRAQAYVVKNGAEKIIRITKDPLSKMQFSQTSNQVGFTALEARDFNEAMEMV